MSNSPLVSYTKLSPNHSGRRNHVIDTISIHCMAGKWLGGDLWGAVCRPGPQGQQQLRIGSDGRIALYVEEANRSWCTSNAANDHRAITIEVANNGGAPDWPVSDKAYAALLDLLTDICRRNGIKKLLWQGDKALIGQVEQQNMTVHRWFAAKACPGDYLYSRHGQIAAEVNRRLEEEEETVDIAKLIAEMTNEQAYQLLQKAELHAKTVAEPAWSQQEGHWAKAVANGIVDGTSPERPAKRDEMIAILGRLGLL